MLRIGSVFALMALWVLLPFVLNGKIVSADELRDTRIQASLSGAPINGVTPAGFSEYRIDDENRRKLDVQATSVNLAAGTVLDVFVNNASVGQMGVDGFGNAFISLDTNNGQNVPFINNGNPIQVRQNGNAILTGSFGTVTPTPSPSGSPSGSPTGSPSASPSGSPTASPSASPSASPNSITECFTECQPVSFAFGKSECFAERKSISIAISQPVGITERIAFGKSERESVSQSECVTHSVAVRLTGSFTFRISVPVAVTESE